jgi:DNA replication protein DnaC
MSPTAPTIARSETISADLRQVLRNLKLSAICDTLPERVALATASHLAYQEFLTLILSDEVERRDRAGAASRARTARLDSTMVLEAFDDTTESVFDRQLWSELTTLRFVDDVRDLCIAGPVGVGKTFMATALGHIAVRRHYSVLMVRADQALKRLRASRLDGTHDSELRRLIRPDLLLVDDFCLQAMDPSDTADIYDVIVERHRRASTVVTTNREPPAEWLAAMADPLLAQSAVDRLLSNAWQLIVEGPSYRARQRPGRPPGHNPSPPPPPRRKRRATI